MSRDMRELLRSTADSPTRSVNTAAVVGKARQQSWLMRATAGVGGFVAVLVVASVVTWLPSDVRPTITDQPGQEMSAEPLLDRTFGSVVVTEGGRPRELLADTQLRIAFDPPSSLRHLDPETGEPAQVDADVVATWSGGCNSVTTAMNVTPERLEPVVGRTTPSQGHARGEDNTLIACEEERSEQDEWFTEVVRAEPRWTLQDDRLTLETERVTIVFEERPHEFRLRGQP